ncbi:MAG: hypothetical protein ABSC37_13830, partial [Xanthobacteraceae bacterium]
LLAEMYSAPQTKRPGKCDDWRIPRSHRLRYDGCLRSWSCGGSRAGLDHPFGRVGDRGIRDRCIRRQNKQNKQRDPAGADLDHHELHDDLQLSGGELPNRVCRARYAADRCGDHHQQCDREHVLFA